MKRSAKSLVRALRSIGFVLAIALAGLFACGQFIRWIVDCIMER